MLEWTGEGREENQSSPHRIIQIKSRLLLFNNFPSACGYEVGEKYVRKSYKNNWVSRYTQTPAAMQRHGWYGGRGLGRSGSCCWHGIRSLPTFHRLLVWGYDLDSHLVIPGFLFSVHVVSPPFKVPLWFLSSNEPWVSIEKITESTKGFRWKPH